MIHSDKILAQQVVSACLANGIERIVISPGSRNAPLVIEFNVYDSFLKYSVVDERSAGFFALGMAQQTHKPVALVCTSGSALLNYYPAITEAFYSNIPLLIISADRPKHLIDIGDGQTIRQENVFENHIYFSANLYENNIPKNYDLLNEAFSFLYQKKGPVHINTPFDEPLYHTTKKSFIKRKKWQVQNKDKSLTEKPLEDNVLQKYANIWNTSSKKLILLGVHFPQESLQSQLEYLTQDPSVIVLTETTSNVSNKKFIHAIDQIVFPMSDGEFKTYQPEVLLTLGGMVISKKIKYLLRKHPPKHHWHINSQKAMDTYHCLSHHFATTPVAFFERLFLLTYPKMSSYQKKWLILKATRKKAHDTFLSQTAFSDLKVFQELRRFVPKKTNIQFSNSSIIRYAQLFDWDASQIIACNRGTSGIEGCVSTAVGVAATSKKPTLLITGDLSFFYDSNALWNRYIPNYFRIILINNGGGGIFRFIPGPIATKTLDYFETPHQYTAKQLCEMHHFSYQKVTNEKDLETALTVFFNKSHHSKLLEIVTPREENAKVLKNYFEFLGSGKV